MGDFWSWAYSSLINVDRGVLAEFLVGHALGVVDGVREPWEPYDLFYSEHPIEAKSSAYIQAWTQEGKLTTPSFGIEPTGAWIYDREGAYVHDPELKRRASVYVFCLYAETDLNKANVLDVPAWEFYVLSTRRIDAELGTQKKLGLLTLRKMVEPVRYSALRQRVDQALHTSSTA